MKIFVIGAGEVGSTIVDSLHEEHDLTVVDTDESRLRPLANRFDVKTFEGNGASRRALQDAGVADAELLIACTSRDEPNLIAAMLTRKLAPQAKTIVRTTEPEYLEVWHERQLDVDFIVSSELEAALAISRLIGVPAARQTDVFADGQVQIVEFDVDAETADARQDVFGKPLREAKLPPNARVASIIRGGKMIPPFGRESILAGDRVIIIGSPHAAHEWSEIMAHGARSVDDVVIYGGGRMGVAVARVLLEQELGVRLVEPDLERAREVAERLPRATVLHATGFDADFLQRERIGHAQAAIVAIPDDTRNLFAAVVAKLHGVPLTIAIVDEAAASAVYEVAGIDVSINPRSLTAEEIVRFAHDPRTQQVAMLEGDRFEILDVTCRSGSEFVGKRLRELPVTGAFVGAIVRNGKAIFPHGDDVLQAGDRAILFTESKRAAWVEQTL